MNFANEQWVGIKYIAQYLDVKEVTVRKWINESKIPCKKIGKQWKFKISEIDEWVNSGKSAQFSTKASK